MKIYSFNINFCLLIAIISCLCSIDMLAQKEVNIWYFGYGEGLDFNPSNGPVSLPGSSISTGEGCATISNKQTGQLLFYTDGISVWNKNHFQMPNGFGLWGNSSSTQSGVIVPWPGSDSLYYIFTVDAQAGTAGGTGYGGFAYSMVDISKQGGLGDVTIKNNGLLTPTCEKITAAKHCNGKDIWVITHQWLTDAFYAYLVTPTGLNTTPVITNIGSVHQGGGSNEATIGYMKVSPNGKRIALATWQGNMNTVEIFDFNNSTGILSNPIIDNLVIDAPYGVSFSANNNLLYVSTTPVGFGSGSKIIQYNLQAGNSAAIVASKTTVATENFSSGFFYGLQLAKNNKIYATQTSSSFLGVIESPDVIGAGVTGCNFNYNGVDVNSGGFGGGGIGLPTFIESFYSIANLGHDTTFCQGNLTLDAGNGGTSYLWSTGATTKTIQVSLSGIYSVQVSSQNCIVQNGIINVNAPPIVNFSPDTAVCGGSVVLNAQNPNSTYLWSTGSSAASIIITSAGTYSVVVNNGHCIKSGTIDVQYGNVKENLSIPNIFTPNGDGINDFFDLKISNAAAYDLKIYNRWGNAVYESKESSQKWDGSQKNDGIYFWVLNYAMCPEQSSQTEKGSITIAR